MVKITQLPEAEPSHLRLTNYLSINPICTFFQHQNEHTVSSTMHQMRWLDCHLTQLSAQGGGLSYPGGSWEMRRTGGTTHLPLSQEESPMESAATEIVPSLSLWRAECVRAAFRYLLLADHEEVAKR